MRYIILALLFSAVFVTAQTPSDTINASPNPFSQRTLVSYTLVSNDTISIRVYNTNGMLVVLLVNDSIVAAGGHQDSLRMDNFPDGIYIISLFNRRKNLKNTKIVKSFGTAIHQQNISNLSLTVYPNPVKDKFIIYGNNNSSDATVILINTLGQAIYVPFKQKHHEEIDIGYLTPGIYFLKVHNSEGQRVFKIVKE